MNDSTPSKIKAWTELLVKAVLWALAWTAAILAVIILIVLIMLPPVGDSSVVSAMVTVWVSAAVSAFVFPILLVTRVVHQHFAQRSVAVSRLVWLFLLLGAVVWLAFLTF